MAERNRPQIYRGIYRTRQKIRNWHAENNSRQAREKLIEQGKGELSSPRLAKTGPQPFSRVKMVEFLPAERGKPARITYRPLTRSVTRTITITPENMKYLTGMDLPFHMRSELLGRF